MRQRRWLPWAVLAAGVVGAIVLVGGRGGNDTGRFFDPTSTSTNGTKALVDSLRALDVDVSVDDSLPTANTTAVLVFVDGMSDRQRRSLTSWTERGGTLVVADRSSPLNPFRVERSTILGLVQRNLDSHCSVAALHDVDRVVVPEAAFLKPRPGSTGCFTSGDGAWLVTEPEGRGSLVVLGGGAAFTNDRIGDADNGLLAMTLLAPRPGARVQVLPLPAPGGGRKTLVDLIAPNVKLAVVQLGAAFLVFALWRARRLGRPVLEAQLVQIPGSELVAAVGRLLQRAGARGRAAELVRDGTRRSLAARLGLPPDAPVDRVAEAASARSGRGVDDVQRVLGGAAPSDEGELVAVTQEAEMLSREVGGAV